MAVAHHGVWGIDIGQAALKAIRLEVIDGVVTATNFDYVEHPKILSQPDADPDQLTREALEQFLSRNNLKGDHVAVSVPGQSGLARFVKLPPVEEKKIGDIVKFEAKQQIPFPLEEVVWDYQKIGSGEVTDGFAMETEIGLFAMKRDQISRALNHFQDVGIEVHTIQMAPLALCNYVAFDLLNKGGTPPAETPPADDAARGKRKCVVGLDVGTDSSNLVITDGEKIIWQRPIPLGGNHLTRALSKELKLTFAKAEHMKRNAAKSPPELKQILAALKPVLGDFVGEVQRSLGFFTNSHRDSQVQYMVGLGSAFRLPGLQKYLAEKLQLEVKKPNSFNRLVGDDVVNAPVFVENLLGFAVPYGLAVQGLGVSKLRTNLLPQEIQFDRMIRAKKPWAVAAASALFLGTAMLAGGYAINYNAVAADSLKQEMTKADTKIAAANKQNSDAAAKELEIQKLQAEVKSVVAGKDEQLDLIRLNEYINECLPTPETPDPKSPNGFRYDGGNLKSYTKSQDYNPPKIVDQRVYWNTKEATDAWREYRDRVRGGQLADAPIDETVRENLVLIDLESVDARYSDNLKNFYDAAKTQSEKVGGIALRGMLKEDFDNPPKDGDKGWVVELRGTTYHKQSVNFLVDSLVHNLTWKARKPAAPAGDAAPPAPPAPDAAAGDAPGPKKVDPIDNLVSHVFVYAYEPDPDPKPGTFVRFGASVLPTLVTSAAAATDAAFGGPPSAGTGGSRDSWQPITSASGPGGPFGSAAGAGGFAGGAGGFGRGRGGEMGSGPGGGRGGERGAGPSGGTPGPFGGPPIPGGPQSPGAAAKKPKPRYEFIVMFIWREPTPSDALMKLDQPSQ